MPGRATAIRAGVIVGPGDPSDRFIYWPLRFARGGEVLVPGTPDDRMQFIDVRDLAASSSAAIDDGIVGVYNAVGPDDPSLGDVLDACRTAVGSDARHHLRRQPVPRGARRPAAGTTSRSPSTTTAIRPASATSRRKKRSRAACRSARPSRARATRSPGTTRSPTSGATRSAPASRPSARPSCYRSGTRRKVDGGEQRERGGDGRRRCSPAVARRCIRDG